MVKMNEAEGSAKDARVLNLGAGRKRLPGALNVDHVSSTSPDVVHDLNRYPWPFASGRFEAVHMYDVLEHLDDVVKALEEVHRVCQPGGRVHITVPHFSSPNAFTDPTHKHHFGATSLHYFTGENELGFYSDARFRRIRSNIIFKPTLANRLVSRLANRWPAGYEERWAWMWPAWFLSFELEVIK